MKCKYRQPTRCNNNGLLIIPVSSTCCGQNNFPKHVELTGIINYPLLLHLVGCLYYLYQRCKVKQISDNEIYLLFKYIKSFLWRVANRLSYTEDARCLKVNVCSWACSCTTLYNSVERLERYNGQYSEDRIIIQKCLTLCRKRFLGQDNFRCSYRLFMVIKLLFT